MHPLKKAILLRGYTIHELSKASGVPASNIYNITQGRGKIGNMGIDSFAKIAHALGLTIDELLEEVTGEE